MDNNEVKKFYEEGIRQKFGSNYEKNRWFGAALDRSRFKMMEKVIRFHLKDVRFEKCFELGPGPGTWTKLLVEHCPRSFFQLLDISEEMKSQFFHNLGESPSIKYDSGDFQNYEPQERDFDFFFSSRAIEYLNDKNRGLANVASLLKSGGRGIIITKTPHYLKQRLLGQKVNWLHKGQITPGEMKKLLKENGFHEIKFYPVIIYVPVLGRANFVNELIWKLAYKSKLNLLVQWVSEAYLVKFEKR